MVRDNLAKALLGIAALVIGLGVLGYFLEQELIVATNWIVTRVGFTGLCAALYLADSLVTPFPPDVLLLVIAKSRLAEHWPTYVTILGFVSVAAGCTGFFIGRWLGTQRWARRVFGEFKEDHGTFLRRYGFWAIVLGAVTPLPYSVTCWSAGVMGLRFTTVLFASILFRVPRFVVYYLVIVKTGALVQG